MKLISSLIFCISIVVANLQSAYAYDKQFVVSSILTDENINVQRLDRNIEIKFGDILVIYSHESNLVLGYAKVLSMTEDSDLLVAKVETHDKNGIIRPENYLKKVDLKKANNEIPGRYDLTVNTDEKIAAKYRPLVYTGLANGMTAANLAKGEFLAGPSILGYGLHRNWQLSSNLISSMFKILNLGVKTKIYDANDFTFSLENTFQYYYLKHRGSYIFQGYLDSNSNSNFKSYSKIKIFTQKPADQYLYNSEEYTNDVNVELQFSYGYMFSNWNQLIFGPKVDVNKRKVGGIIGYYFLDKNVSSMIGVTSNDFSEFRLGKQAYLINYDLWWRF